MPLSSHSLTRNCSFWTICGLCAVSVYSYVVLRYVYDTAIRVPKVQRVPRELQKVRLPRLYFCPADRSLQRREFGHRRRRKDGRPPTSSLRWLAGECGLSFQDQLVKCNSKLKGYRGWAPDDFHGRTADAAERKDGGECIEFGTHWTDIREEWSASWNEVSLRASFEIDDDSDDLWDELREVELGYRPAEWKLEERKDTLDRYYYPLLRVPYFVVDGTSHGSGTSGVATRAYLGEEVEKTLKTGEKNWWVYGAVQTPVDNATLPVGSRKDLQDLPREKDHQSNNAQQRPDHSSHVANKVRTGVVHVILSLEDFTAYNLETVSYFVPLMQAFGDIAGVVALFLVWMRFGSSSARLGQRPIVDDVDCGAGSSLLGGVELTDRFSRGHSEDVRYSRVSTDEAHTLGETERLTDDCIDEEGDGGL